MAALLLGGCQSSPQPRAPRLEVNTVLQQGQDGSNVSQSINDITKARHLVDGLIGMLDKETENRRNGQEAINDTTFFSTLTAVAGVVAKSIAARNVGAGVAGITSSTGAHYQFDKQKAAFQKALSSAQCLRSALNGIDEDTFELFPNYDLGKDASTDTDYGKLYAAIPGITYDRYMDIVNQLTNDLDGISTASGSLADVQSVADDVREAAEKSKAVKTGSDAGRVQGAQDQLASAGADVAKAKADQQTLQAGSASDIGAALLNGNRVSQLRQLLMASAQVAFAQGNYDKAVKAADPSAEPKRIAFLVAVVGFKANAELCTKVTVNK